MLNNRFALKHLKYCSIRFYALRLLDISFAIKHFPFWKQLIRIGQPPLRSDQPLMGTEESHPTL